MKDKNDILNKALDELRRRGRGQEVPKEVMEGTLSRLRNRQSEYEGLAVQRRQRHGWLKVPIAAALMMAVGFAAAKMSGPDTEQLTSEIEAKLRPQIAEAVVRELSPLIKEGTQTAVLVGCGEVANELSGQLRADVDRMGLQVLAASGALTNQRLEQLIESINAAQHQERRWITAAFDQIESNRMEDKIQLAGGLTTLAAYTEDELARTKQDFVNLLSYSGETDSIQNELNEQKP
jgi:hypothetical protein